MPYASPEKKKANDSARYWANREKILAQHRVYVVANRVRRAAYRKEFYATNRAKILACSKEYYTANKAAIAAQHTANLEKTRVHNVRRYEKDANYRLRCNLRTRIGAALAGKSKSARTLELLGCSIEFLRAHLEKQFFPGMTWENQGSVWHIDHILPCAKFHLQHSEEQEICFNWSNLQPLFAKDNLLKGDKIL